MREDSRLILHDVFPRIIAFIGADGVGKTTQSQLLIKYLKDRRIKSKKVSIQSTHALLYYLWRMLRRVGFYKKEVNQFGYVVGYIPRIDKSSFKRVWVWLDILNITLKYIYDVYVSLKLGYTIVADRYLADSVVALAYLTQDDNFLKSLPAKILLSLTPKNTFYIFLDCDYETLLKRRNLTVMPKKTIEFYKAKCLALSKALGAHVIDTTHLSIKETFNKIKGLLFEFDSDNKITQT